MEDKVEVVISGAAGAFPECKNIPELEEALFKKTNLITDDKRKWDQSYDFPTHCGKAFSHETFDAMFFNVPPNLPNRMDTITKRCLETSVEAIFDAGVNPKMLKGSQTAVYATYEASESEQCLCFKPQKSVVLGTFRTFSSNRISFALNLYGPSYTIAGGYGAMFQLIGHARSQLQEGIIDAAIVVGANYLLTARPLAILDGMGLAARDGKCCPFDTKAHGYALSESCVAFFLQRADDARRNYATIIGSDHRFFGSRPGNILSFNGESAKQMLHKLYTNWNVDPSTVGYIEADGCGIKDRDLGEIDVISDVFCKNRKEPLLIGSIKSNMGHAESAACGAGVVKALIALNRSKIPPSINCSSPVPELSSNNIQVVTESTSLQSDLVAVNAIGISGHFGHILLQKNPKGVSTGKITESLPQILLLSSRTEKGIEHILELTKTVKMTPEFAGLLNGVFCQEVKNHMYRGYKIVTSNDAGSQPKTQRLDGARRPVWWVFSGMGSQWNGMGSKLLHIPVFRDVIHRCDKVLKPRGVDIMHVLTTDDNTIFDNILNAFVGITAVQIGLVEVLRALELEPDYIVGHSLGEAGCAYADNCLTLEQTILAAYARGIASLEADLITGKMAAVGLGHDHIVTILPETIDVACRNSSTSCTLSGPAADLENFVEKLESKGVFAKTVNVANIAYHSRYVQPVGPILLKHLKELIPTDRKRSKKWISTSVPKERWKSDLAMYSSAEYHTNNLTSPVLFEDALNEIPSNAVLIEIAPHGLLQAILKRAVSSHAINVPLTHRSSSDGVKFLLEAIGYLYLLGLEPNVSALYPSVEYPVPCDTPSLQPFVTWDHSESYGLPDYMPFCSRGLLSAFEQIIPLTEVRDAMNGYESNNTPVSFLSFCLVKIWRILGGTNETSPNRIPACFEDIQIYSEINLSTKDPSDIYMSILPGGGQFVVVQVLKNESEATENETVLLRGRIKFWTNPKNPSNLEEFTKYENTIGSRKNVESCFSDFFGSNDGLKQRISELKICDKGILGKIRWSQDWVINLDTIIKINMFKTIQESSTPAEPSSIHSIYLLPDWFQSKNNGSSVEFYIDTELRRFDCGVVLLDGLKTKSRIKEQEVVKRLHFVPYGDTSFTTEHEFVQACLQVIVENSAEEIGSDSTKIYIFNPQEEPAIDQMINTLKDTICTSDEQNIDFVVNSRPNNKISQHAAYLSIFSNVNASSRLNCLENTENAYSLVLHDGNPREAGGALTKDHVVIYDQTFGTQRFTFFKTVSPNKRKRSCIVTKNWRSDLDTLRADKIHPDETVLFVIDGPSLPDPFSVIEVVLKERRPYNIRCFLILDEDVPDFTPHSELNREQIQREMMVNVYKNGRWGCYRRQTVPPTELARLLPAMLLGNCTLGQVHIKYLGFNETNPTDNEVGMSVYDYSGVTTTGDRVMGIASRKSGLAETISLDPILKWKLPPGISLEVGATLPFPFLMACLMIQDASSRGPDQKRVLIHNGHKPIGAVCIALALHEGHTIYTTVPDDAAKEMVLRNFPQIPISRIANHNDKAFFVPMMMETGGLGADLVISDLSSEQMLDSWACLSHHGSFFNLNESVLAHSLLLPMAKFLSSTSFFSYTKANILGFSDERKRRLHKLVDTVLMFGPKVRIPYRILTSDDVYIDPCLSSPSLQSGAKTLLKLCNANSHNIKVEAHKK